MALGELGQAAGVPKGSLLRVTEEMKKITIVPPGEVAPNPILIPILDSNVIEMVPEDLYESEAEKITDILIKNTRATGELSKWVPEMTFVTGCMDPKHVMTDRLDKGLFVISGNVLANMSVKQTMDWMDGPGSKIKGCGYGGCDVTLSEAMGHHLSEEEVDCYSCTNSNRVNLSEACPNHPMTKLDYLAVASLAHVSKWYKLKARFIQMQDKTLPHTTVPKAPDQQIFPVCTKQAL